MAIKKTTGNAIHLIDGLFVPYTQVSESVGPRGGMKTVMRYWEGYPTREQAEQCIRMAEAGEGNLPGGIPVDGVGRRLK